MISWGDIGGKRKPSRFTPVSPNPKIFGGGVRNKTGNMKKNTPPFMYISLPPGTGVMCTNFAE